MSDLIKREDAIKAVAEVLSLNRFASFKDIKDFGRFAERMLRNVPSADRPSGEWEIEEFTSIYGKGYGLTCSECGDVVTVTDEALPRESCCRPCYKSADSYCSDGEREDEPQTCEECEHWNDTEDGCADRHGCKTENCSEIPNNCEDEPQTESTGSPIGDYRDGVGAWQTERSE